MPDPFYAWHVGDLTTGRLAAEVPIAESAFQAVMDDAGTLSFSTILTDPAVQALNLYTAAEPCRCFLALAYTDATGSETFLDAGPIWTHAYDAGSGRLTVNGAGLWSYYDHRKILPVLLAGVNPATVSTSFTAALGGVAKGLVQLAHTHTGGSVPVVFPADQPGTDTWTYAGYDMDALGQALRDITQVDGGPEIQFVPRRSDTDRRYLVWDMRVGTAAQPLLAQSGDDLVFDQSAQRSQVRNISVQRDGTKMADRWWTQGAGTDVATLFGRADDATGLIAAGFPLLEGNDARNDVADQTHLNGYAARALAGNARSFDTYTLTVHRDGVQGSDGVWRGPNAGTCRVGSWVALTVGGQTVDSDGTVSPREPYLAPLGDTRLIRGRITSVSGDQGAALTLNLASEVES